MRSLLLKVSILMLLLLPAPATAAETPPGSPSATVERLNAALLEVMQQAEALGFAGRYAELEPTLTEIFDFPAMARITLGSQWSRLSDAQQAAFTQAFADYSVGVFADRFDGFGGERFEVLGEEEARRGAVLVRNQIVKSDGEAVEINYLTQPQDDGSWRIVDTILGGTASELAARRGEYSSIMRKLGVEALIQTLKDKTAGFAND
ncbi:ABC transporter substrate-binding protein [Pelagibius marinus]|uniref:ABC transporter substrate-binding protein n=1 Tax=Pelagibius marinus TaxID=2762760 RepID=UPI001872EBE3|nr:ABC transporter substrate-binding protein [Pelagibius marinus]